MWTVEDSLETADVSPGTALVLVQALNLQAPYFTSRLDVVDQPLQATSESSVCDMSSRSGSIARFCIDLEMSLEWLINNVTPSGKMGDW